MIPAACITSFFGTVGWSKRSPATTKRSQFSWFASSTRRSSVLYRCSASVTLLSGYFANFKPRWRSEVWNIFDGIDPFSHSTRQTFAMIRTNICLLYISIRLRICRIFSSTFWYFVIRLILAKIRSFILF